MILYSKVPNSLSKQYSGPIQGNASLLTLGTPSCAYIPSGEYKATLMAGSGIKAEILDLMKEQTYTNKLNNTFAKLLDMLEDF